MGNKERVKLKGPFSVKMTEDGLLFSEGRKREMKRISLVSKENDSVISFPTWLGHYFIGKRIFSRGINVIALAMVFMCLSFTSCQKGKEPETRKKVQTHREETIQTQSVEQRTEGRLKLGIQQPASQEPKGQSELQVNLPSPQDPEKEKKEVSLASQPNPLTEEEQKLVDEIGKNILIAPTEYFESQEDAVPYLKVLLKGNHRNIRLYKGYEALSEDRRKREYDEAMSKAVMALNPKTKVGLKLIIEVLKTRREYPISLSEAAKVVKFSQDRSVIPLLREVVKSPSIRVRLEAAGTLLALGDADTALPVLDELTKEGATSALGFIYHEMQGKKWEQKGIESIRKALTYDNNESKALAALFWVRLKKEDRDYIEKLTIDLLQGILKKERWGGEERRACESAIYTLLEIRSEKSIPVLQAIAKHPDASYLENRANKAIVDIEKGRSE